MSLQVSPNCFKEKGKNLFSIASGDRIKNNGIELQQGRLGLDIRKKIPVVKIAASQNILLGGILEALSLQYFRAD